MCCPLSGHDWNPSHQLQHRVIRCYPTHTELQKLFTYVSYLPEDYPNDLRINCLGLLANRSIEFCRGEYYYKEV